MPRLSLRFLLLIAVLAPSSSWIALSSGAEPLWTRDNVVGLAMSLNDPVYVEEYTFGERGVVLVTFGRKNGPVTAPVFRWKIENGRLLILDENEIFFRDLRMVGRNSKTITAEDREGKTLHYTIRREP